MANPAAVIVECGRCKRQVDAVRLQRAARRVVERARYIDRRRAGSGLRDRAAVIDEVRRVQCEQVCARRAAAVIDGRRADHCLLAGRECAGVRDCRACRCVHVSVGGQRAVAEEALRRSRSQVLPRSDRPGVRNLSGLHGHIAVAADGAQARAARAVIQRARSREGQAVRIERCDMARGVVE